MKTGLYFDYAAATPLDPKVLAAMQPYLTDNFYNASASYSLGRGAKTALETAKATLAAQIGTRPGEIVLTAGGTEANNLAIRGVMDGQIDANILISAIEHPSILEPAKKYHFKEIPVNHEGLVDIDELIAGIDDKTVLISVGLVNHELGTVQPIKQIADAVKEIVRTRQKKGISRPLLLHTDASQAVNTLDLHVARLGVDLMTINGGKAYGPKQTGALFVKGAVELKPLILGGGQERGLRSGTENVAGAVGLARAIEIAAKKRHAELKRLGELRVHFVGELTKNLSEVVVNGSSKHFSPHILNLSFPDADNERLMIELDEAGLQVAVGSACSTSSEEPSHVLSAIGLSENQINSSLRFSFGRPTTMADIDVAIELLKRFYKPSRQ